MCANLCSGDKIKSWTSKAINSYDSPRGMPCADKRFWGKEDQFRVGLLGLKRVKNRCGIWQVKRKEETIVELWNSVAKSPGKKCSQGVCQDRGFILVHCGIYNGPGWISKASWFEKIVNKKKCIYAFSWEGVHRFHQVIWEYVCDSIMLRNISLNFSDNVHIGKKYSSNI